MFKRIMSIIFAAVLLLSAACLPAYADSTPFTFTENEEQEITLHGDQTIAGEFKKYGTYTILAYGLGSYKITIWHINTLNQKIIDYELFSDKGYICEVCDFTDLSSLISLVSNNKYQFEMTSENGKDAYFKLLIINSSSRYSCFTSLPKIQTNGKLYYEDIDYSVNSLNTVTFLNGNPDMEGAEFTFRNSNGNNIYTLKGNDVYAILAAPVFESSLTKKTEGKIVFYTKSGLSYDNNKITFTGMVNPIGKINYITKPSDFQSSYTFGTTDGTIHGTLSNYYFTPNIKFDGCKFEIEGKAFTNLGKLTLEAQKDDKGYYLDLSSYGYGKIYISYKAEIKENKDADVNIPILLGKADNQYKLTVHINKAGFFKMIGIWFGLLFGKYR